MIPSLQFFGVAAYKLITASGVHIMIDPFLDDNPYSPIKSDDIEHLDMLLITHNAFDHFGDAPKLIKKFKCPVICALDVLHRLVHYHDIDRDLFRVTIWGMVIEECGVNVRPVESHHWSFGIAPDGSLLSGPAMGFIVDIAPDISIYHPGDTALTYDMKLWGELYKPTLGLIHVSLPEGEGVSLPHMECYKSGELTPYESILASQWLGLDHVVVSHYVDPECDDVVEFLKLVETHEWEDGLRPKVTVLEPGEVIEL